MEWSRDEVIFIHIPDCTPPAAPRPRLVRHRACNGGASSLDIGRLVSVTPSRSVTPTREGQLAIGRVVRANRDGSVDVALYVDNGATVVSRVPFERVPHHPPPPVALGDPSGVYIVRGASVVRDERAHTGGTVVMGAPFVRTPWDDPARRRAIEERARDLERKALALLVGTWLREIEVEHFRFAGSFGRGVTTAPRLSVAT